MKKIFLLFCIICLPVCPVSADDSIHVFTGEQPDFLMDNLDDLDEFDDLDEDYLEVDDVYDPLETMNRVFFQFNDKLYFWVLKPVKIGYSFVVPTEFRECIGNFFNNLAAPIRLINNILQGRFKDAGVVISRFLINTTLGVGGLGDVAYVEFDLEPRRADFGQTLGGYGIGEGVFICWPLIGPSNVRDTVGIIGDTFIHPAFYVDMTLGEFLTYYTANKVNAISLTPGVYEDMKKYSLDPYIATRQAFYDYRRNIIKKSSDNRDVNFFNQNTSVTQPVSAQEYIMRTSNSDK